jgi:muramoyltetrapeptide carboxypeptidase
MELLRPKAIAPGMTLGVVSPSSAIEAEDLEKGLEPFYQRGYKIVLGEHALARRGYLAGTDEQRAHDLMAMFARDDIDAVLCSRGGYGAARLIPYLDPAVFRSHPKLLIGYSDITVLHLWLLRQVGLVGLYAPMPITMTRPIPDHAMEVFWRALEVAEPLGELPPWNAPYRTIVPGKAQGRLTGGCLCLMADSIGAPYELDTRDAIVIIEDVDEPPYRLDAMLNHLALAASGRSVAESPSARTPAGNNMSRRASRRSRPTRYWTTTSAGCRSRRWRASPFGHIKDPLTLPYGVLAELDSERGTLAILESATVQA